MVASPIQGSWDVPQTFSLILKLFLGGEGRLGALGVFPKEPETFLRLSLSPPKICYDQSSRVRDLLEVHTQTNLHAHTRKKKFKMISNFKLAFKIKN